MNIKRKIADLLEVVTGARIVSPGALPFLFEQEHLTRFFRHFEVDCVFDVGANAGQYADMIRSRCGYSGPIVSFEPIPDLAAAMKSRAGSNWFVEQMAITDAPGEVAFNVAADSQFSSMNDPSEQPRFQSHSATLRTIKVPASTLADQFEKYARLIGFRRPFLKMDTQGSDLVVARSAGTRLHEFVGIQSELSFDPIYKSIPSAEQAIAFYRSQGFVLSAFVPNNEGHFPHLYEMDCILYRAHGRLGGQQA